MTFGIGPHRLGRILPGGVEMKRRNRCGEGAEKAIRSQRPRVGAPGTGDINQERVSACGPRRVECAKTSAIVCGSQEIKEWSLTA